MKRLGLDLGGTKIEGVVLADDGKILIRKRISTPRDSDNAIAYTEMLSAIRNFITELENNVNSPCSIGIGTPGTISAETGLLKNSNTVCLNGKPFLDDLKNCLNRDIRIANDANCFALSESTNGAGKGYASVFGIIMGTGVGGGIVINNCIHAGAMGIAGEWGHNPLQANGPDCYCGRSGCVETLISGPGFVSDYQRSGGNLGVHPAEIIELAERGDPIASASVKRFLSNFGRAVATVINILDPHVIVLGGGLSNLDILYTRGRKAIEPHVFSDQFTTPVLKNQHGDSSGVLGAAYLWD